MEKGARCGAKSVRAQQIIDRQWQCWQVVIRSKDERERKKRLIASFSSSISIDDLCGNRRAVGGNQVSPKLRRVVVWGGSGSRGPALALFAAPSASFCNSALGA